MNKHDGSSKGATHSLGAALLGFTFILSGCSGGSGGGGVTVDTPISTTVTIGGVIDGNDASVTLSLNGVEQTFSGPNFTFDNMITSLDNYNVAFVSTPAEQSCIVSNNIGIAVIDVTNVSVLCTAPSSILRFNDANISGRLNAGDFNGDGLPDLAFSISTMPSHPTGSNNSIMRFAFGNGAGVFTQTTDIDTINDGATPNKQGRDSVAIDLNNDGFDDFAQSTGLLLEAYSGNNTNIPQSLFNSGEYLGAPLVSFDVDGNGYNDFIGQIFGGSVSNFLAMYRNNGDGTFGAMELFAHGAQGLGITISSFTSGDFNNDGDTDLLVIGYGFPAALYLAFYAGDGAGNFADPSALIALTNDLYLGEPVSGITYKEITTGDFNGDGNIDVAITSTTSFLQVMLGDGAGGFSEGQRVIIGSQPIHVRAEDFNNDGNLDLASINDGSKTLHLSFGAGDGTFGDSSGAASGWISTQLDGNASFYDMDIADFNLDNYLDIALAEFGSQEEGMGRGSITLLFGPGK